MTGQYFGRLSHHQSRKGIVKAVAVHAINQFRMTHAHSEARAFSKIGNTRHAFCAAGKNNLSAAKHDLFSRQDDRSQTRPAGLVDGKRRHAIRYAGSKSDLSRDVRPAAGLPGATPD